MELKLNNISKNYQGKIIFNNIDYRFKNNCIYGLLGRNGVGKTTLFNMISHNIKYDGNICFNGNENYLDEVGFISSTPNVPNFLTAREFLKFFVEMNKERIKDIKTIDEYFDFININESDRDKLLINYSHGMKNKIELLINIIGNYKILLLDEPLTNLDIVANEEIKNILKSISKNRIIIFSTHILELAKSLCDEIVLINKKSLKKINKENIKDILMEELYE